MPGPATQTPQAIREVQAQAEAEGVSWPFLSRTISTSGIDVARDWACEHRFNLLDEMLFFHKNQLEDILGG